eukprot:gnl/Ergobibamus_cyprinoides/4487.p2 GENE.gnl/Ergobibamus_cyprinoides/4487~~gnl/Ergobibamus_cyprinoides/4487.p2  ORF type:complete len:110 (-),score=0.43 gnl/Ergobibamus_cyprinoides/4487:81-410(-)
MATGLDCSGVSSEAGDATSGTVMPWICRMRTSSAESVACAGPAVVGRLGSPAGPLGESAEVAPMALSLFLSRAARRWARAAVGLEGLSVCERGVEVDFGPSLVGDEDLD